MHTGGKKVTAFARPLVAADAGLSYVMARCQQNDEPVAICQVIDLTRDLPTATGARSLGAAAQRDSGINTLG
jgi:hypothetical protein